MKTNQELHKLHLNEWTQRFADQKASGLTVKQWCEEHDFSIHTYNYWKRVLKEEERVRNQEIPDIVPLALAEPVCGAFPISQAPSSCSQPMLLTSSTSNTSQVTAVLTINDITIEVPSDISENFLCTLIKAVRHA